MQKFLIIQTAFLGDVILATPILRELKLIYPNAEIDVLVRKGNEILLSNNPHVRNVLIWDKNNGKYKNLFRLLRHIRNENYDEVIGIQRYINSGLLTAFSKAKTTIGFANNPLSFLFTHKITHQFGNGTHEVERNLSLIQHHTSTFSSLRPEIYPSNTDYQAISAYTSVPYYCIAPTSVWFTKQLERSKWVELIHHLDSSSPIYLLGAPNDAHQCEQLIQASNSENVINLAGKLSLLESAALIAQSKRTYVNDSGPLHIASAMNAKVSAFFCSTVPSFGFGPLSEDAQVIETHKELSCRPCGLHGHKACPAKHFECSNTIDTTLAHQ